MNLPVVISWILFCCNEDCSVPVTGMPYSSFSIRILTLSNVVPFHKLFALINIMGMLVLLNMSQVYLKFNVRGFSVTVR
jgi:hypothetical protein